MRIHYKSKKFGDDSLDIIERANAICAEFQAQGFDLTLRQLYYQFVARGYIPNNDKSYKRLGSIVNDARLAGLLDWDYIVDRTRNLRDNPHWNTPADIVHAAASSYANDKWADQPTRIEVWIEKDALIGVIEGTCKDEDVEHFSCRGYVSQSEMWAAAQRMFDRAIKLEQNTVILHLGDHDPSGIDMTRDINDRLRMFVMQDYAHWYVRQDRFKDNPDFVDEEGKLTERGLSDYRMHATDWYRRFLPRVERIALTMEQVEEFNPPPNPAKLTDARSSSYVEEYGYESWELDALNPTTLAQLILDGIEEYRDPTLWEEAVDREEEGRVRLLTLAREWEAA